MRSFIKYTLVISLSVLVVSVLLLAAYLWQLSKTLPAHTHLVDYEPSISTRVHALDGTLVAEYASQRRLFVPVQKIPPYVVNAFLSAEDKNFTSHSGIYFPSILRAFVDNIGNLLTNQRLVGASTITQQVAKNFLLTSEVTLERKVKEFLLALRLEKTYDKNRILELYLNEIYLGSGNYGVAAAALDYFGKSLEQVSLAEAAYLAALPKAPNNYHPVRNYARALARRNWVLDRMRINGFITPQAARNAKEQSLEVPKVATGTRVIQGAYFTEEVRRRISSMYGDDMLYRGGLSVRSTLHRDYQALAQKSLRRGLEEYTQRHGWLGPLTSLASTPRQTWHKALYQEQKKYKSAPWPLAVVTAVAEQTATLGLVPDDPEAMENLVEGVTRLQDNALMRVRKQTTKRANARAAKPLAVKNLTSLLKVGDVVFVEPVATVPSHDPLKQTKFFSVRQIPKVNGAMVVLDPHTGRVLAMVGGYSFAMSQFNRAVQAQRQPGSAFKPFVYAAALAQGYTPSSLILDAPFVIKQGGGDDIWWRPENYGNRFYGPSTLRMGVEKSRNLMTVRLAQEIGMDYVVDYANKFQLTPAMRPMLSMVLGAGETTLVKLTAAYASFVNGGRYVKPIVIDKVQNRYGNNIFRSDTRDCPACQNADWHNQPVPELSAAHPRIMDEATAYQIVSLLEGVVKRGTGRKAGVKNRTLAGKTGTTNEAHDAWFLGFSPNLVVGVYVGYDDPSPLGGMEGGGSVAAPIFRYFMNTALAGSSSIPFRVPPTIKLVQVHGKTGTLMTHAAGSVYKNNPNVILEAFKLTTQPPVSLGKEDKKNSLRTGTGGLY